MIKSTNDFDKACLLIIIVFSAYPSNFCFNQIRPEVNLRSLFRILTTSNQKTKSSLKFGFVHCVSTSLKNIVTKLDLYLYCFSHIDEIKSGVKSRNKIDFQFCFFHRLSITLKNILTKLDMIIFCIFRDKVNFAY